MTLKAVTEVEGVEDVVEVVEEKLSSIQDII
jgi:hypothetical protein